MSDKQVSTCIIKIDGRTLVEGKGNPQQTDATWLLESCQVDLRTDAPAMFTFDLQMRTGANIQLLDDLEEGKPVEILMGPQGQEKPVLKGEIHYIEPHFRFEGNSTVTVGGYEPAHRLTRGTSSRTWGDGIQSDELHTSAFDDVVQKSQDHGGTRDNLTTDQVAAASPKTKVAYVPQLNASDYQFLRHAQSGKPDTGSPPVKVLQREATRGQGETLVHEVHFNLSTVKQYAKVEVRGWDPKRKKSIVGVATAADFDFGSGTKGWEATGKALYGKPNGGKVYTVVDRPVDSQEEADAVAKDLFNQLSMDFLTGEVGFEGDPAVKAGSLVEMKGFGKRFDGKYLVTACTHDVRPRSHGYVTRCKIARNDIGSK